MEVQHRNMIIQPKHNLVPNTITNTQATEIEELEVEVQQRNMLIQPKHNLKPIPTDTHTQATDFEQRLRSWRWRSNTDTCSSYQNTTLNLTQPQIHRQQRLRSWRWRSNTETSSFNQVTTLNLFHQKHTSEIGELEVEVQHRNMRKHTTTRQNFKPKSLRLRSWSDQAT